MTGKGKKLNIFFATSECVPYAKTGGLADVLGALPREFVKLGHDVSVVMPYYSSVKSSCPAAEDTGIKLHLPLGKRLIDGSVLRYRDKSGVVFFFIRKDKYYMRDSLYGTAKGDFKDNASRFIFFSKAVISLANALKTPIDVLHCHDWQTGTVPALMRYGASNSAALKNTKTIFTIHNLGYLGRFWYYDFQMTGLPEEAFTSEGLEFFSDISLIKAGIVYSDAVTTVSKKYSREILTKEFGCGLEGILATRKKNLYGILNGVDYDAWSPEKDHLIAKKYSVNDLSGKLTCRRSLLKEFGMKLPDNVPLIGIVSRLDTHKGFDLIIDQIEKLLTDGAAFVLLGTGDKDYEKLFRGIGKKYPERAGIKIEFNNKLAHMIEAGSDMFLMPSWYEPCGLNQMYSLKYGTIPIVRSTGGLDDTITTYNPQTGKGNGFKFKKYTSKALLRTIETAVDLFGDKSHWNQLMRNAMLCNFSWGASTRKYIRLYRKILAN